MDRVEALGGRRSRRSHRSIAPRAAISGRHTLANRTPRKPLKTFTRSIRSSTQTNLATRADFTAILQ
jgi:hypothetical protein